MVNEFVWVCIIDRGFMLQFVKWSLGVVLEVCGDWWYFVQMGVVIRCVYVDYFIRVFDNQKMLVDLGNLFEEGSCL